MTRHLLPRRPYVGGRRGLLIFGGDRGGGPWFPCPFTLAISIDVDVAIAIAIDTAVLVPPC